MALFGQDFIAARQTSLYVASSGQHPLIALGFAVALFLFYSLLQLGLGFLAHVLLYGSLPGATNQAGFLKAMVVGILPAAIITVIAAWWVAGFGNRSADRGIPLSFPDLGAGGWAVTIVGFVFAMYVVFILVFVLTGIDPQAYVPTPGGVGDSSSSAGPIEKTIADLADEPFLFALAIPSVALGAPLVEEFVFRGALFSALRATRLGSFGALVLTSAAWALVHGAATPWLFIGPLFVMGLILGWSLLRFGSLWIPIILHCTWNGLASLAFFAASNSAS